MSRTIFTLTNTATLPHPLSTVSSILLSPSPPLVSRVLLLSPIASSFTHTHTEPVFIPPGSSSTPFPSIRPADTDHPANGTRTHFTYVETVTLLFGLYKFSFPLSGWFAVEDGEGATTGYVEIVASPGRPRVEQTTVRKVRVLEEVGEGGTSVREVVEVDIRWGVGWLARGKAREAHTACMGRYGELFEGGGL